MRGKPQFTKTNIKRIKSNIMHKDLKCERHLQRFTMGKLICKRIRQLNENDLKQF